MIYLTCSAAIVLCITLVTFVVDLIISAPKASGPATDHFDGKIFFNPPKKKVRSLRDIIKRSTSADPGEWKKSGRGISSQPPAEFHNGSNEIAFTFINHSTYLIQTHGLNILTDPIWSERASPFQWVGPKRMCAPGLCFEDLPAIDLVLISHNHYDHLDIQTVIDLNEAFEPLFIVPLGVGAFLEKNGIYNVAELDWWQRHPFDHHLTVNAVPARHFSGRGLTDRDRTLWCGFVLEFSQGNIYFAGDTGYDDFFSEIGKRFAPVHTALIPIGAYRPRWFMAPIHVNPEEAVQIHRELGARQSLGTHYGTFPLADDGMTEPVEDLERARTRYNLAEEEFRALTEGETAVFCFDEEKTMTVAEGAAGSLTGRKYSRGKVG